MKVCILTFAVTNNYGATLQCYALSKFIQQQGHETMILNVPLQKAGALRAKVSLWKHVKGRFKRTFNIVSENTRYPRNHKQIKQDSMFADKNMVLFDQFREKYFDNLTHEYINEEDFEKDYPKADLYIVGSDQVWNVWVTNYQYPIFFFSFIKHACRRISYAACMGGNTNFEFTNDEISKISLLLSKFDSISVRDKTGVDILKNRFDVSALQVLDPTFLIDSYDELLKDSSIDASNCMFNFKFIINDAWVEVIKTIAGDLNLKIRMDTCLIPIDGLPFHPLCGVQDWLKLIKTADFIFTDSFHGMVFCILFRKQFIATPSYKGGEERYFDLASKFGLEDRVFTTVSDVKKSKAWHKRIDYDKVYEKMGPLRNASRNYLIKQLSILR